MTARLREALLYAAGAIGATLLGLISYDVLGRSLRVPLYYEVDALFYGAAVKGTIENGWYEVNPYLGAPMGQVQHDFPQADNLPYVLAKVLGWFSNDWALVFNLTYLLSFPLAAIAGIWFFRLVGCGRSSALVMGLLYAIAPYHYFHGISHLALSMYFVVPLGLGLAYLAFLDRPLWHRRGRSGWRNPREWATWPNAAVLTALALLGSTSSYYSVFTLLMLSTVLAALALRRRFAPAGGVLVVMGALVVVMLANMAPDIWWSRTSSTATVGFERLPMESEIFALKLSSLVLPTHWNRIGSLGEWRLEHDAAFPLPSEPTALGVVAAVGFLILLLFPVLRIALHRSADAAGTSRGPTPLVSALGALAVFTLVAFLFSTVGGFDTLFAVLVTPSIRSWARMAIVIALLALAAVGLLLDAGVRRFVVPQIRDRTAGVRYAAVALPAALVLAVGLFDQMPSDAWTARGTEAAEYASDEAYATGIEELVPSQGIVLQVPYLAFPESPPMNELTDYDPIRGYLHTDDVRWTYGAFKGTSRSGWSQRLLVRPGEEVAIAAAASGIAGVHVDRYAFEQRDASSVEDGLRAVVGPAAVESNDDRFAFYDLAALRSELEDDVPAPVLDRVRRAVLQSPAIHWAPDFIAPSMEADLLVGRSSSTAPSITVVNVLQTPARLAISFTVRAENADDTATIDITWPDGRATQVVAPPGAGTVVERSVTVPPGESRLSFVSDVGPSVTLISPSVVQPRLSADLARIVEALDAPAPHKG